MIAVQPCIYSGSINPLLLDPPSMHLHHPHIGTLPPPCRGLLTFVELVNVKLYFCPLEDRKISTQAYRLKVSVNTFLLSLSSHFCWFVTMSNIRVTLEVFILFNVKMKTLIIAPLKNSEQQMVNSENQTVKRICWLSDVTQLKGFCSQSQPSCFAPDLCVADLSTQCNHIVLTKTSSDRVCQEFSTAQKGASAVVANSRVD